MELVYSRFDLGSWTGPATVSSDETGELDAHWWSGASLTFVEGSQESPASEHMIAAEIDTAFEDGPNRSPLRGWTIFVDNTIRVLPSSRILSDGEPSLGMIRLGDTVIPTVTWAHAVRGGDHDPVLSRFVNGTWTTAQSIAVNPLDDRHPSVAQDTTRTVHAAWGRDSADGSFDEEVHYTSNPEGASLFSTEARVSRSGESAFNPSIAVLPSGEVFIAYESERNDAASRVIVARRAERSHGEGYAFRHRVAGRTSGEVPADPELTSLAEGSLLLTWIESPSSVGFRVFSNGRWTATELEPIGLSETASDVRHRMAASLRADESNRQLRRLEDH